MPKALLAGGQAIDPQIDVAIQRGSDFFAFYVNKGEEYTPEETGWLSIKDRISNELETSGHEVIYKAYEIGKECNVPMEGLISNGIPSQEILKYTDAYGIIKLIVMAHSSKGKAAQEFVDSTTKNVVAGSRVPVVVTDWDISVKSILLAVDGSAGARKATAYARNLAKALDAVPPSQHLALLRRLQHAHPTEPQGRHGRGHVVGSSCPLGCPRTHGAPAGSPAASSPAPPASA